MKKNNIPPNLQEPGPRTSGPALMTAILLFLSIFQQRAFSQTFTVTPSRAYDYVDGIGVNTHLRFGGTPYYNAFETVLYPKLKELGIRHIRDGVPYKEFLAAADTLTIKNRFIKLHDSLGIKVCYALDSRKVVDTLRLRDSANYLSVFQSSDKLRQSIQYLEGFNEPDLTIYGWYPTKWDTLTYAIQKGLWNKAHSMTELSGIKVVSTSLVTYYNASRIGQMAAMTPYLSTYYDYANYHPYDAGGHDNNFFPGYTYDWNKQNTIMDTMRHNKPWLITEAGYENALNWNLPSSTGYLATTYHYLSELASGKYYSVLFMEMFKRGAKKVYGYEFIDLNTSDQSHSENNFGIIHSDGTPKPAFTAIKNTIGILNDDSASFTPTSLTYTLSGDVTGINNSLYQKSNGHYFLALWQGITKGVCYNFLNFTDLPADSQSVKIVLPFVSAKVKIYQPLVSGSPVYTYTNKDTIQVQVPDHLLLIEIAPQAAGPQAVVPGIASGLSSMKVASPLPKNGVHVGLRSKERQTGIISIYSSTGARLSAHSVTVEKGDNNYDLDCNLAAGIYVAVFKSDKGSISQKFIR